MTIGERIKQRREELNITQDELARKLGYKSRSSINKIELNGRNLTQQKIKLIAEALQTTPSYIMGWAELDPEEEVNRMIAPIAEGNYYINKLLSLPEDKKEQVYKFIDFISLQ